MKKLQGFFELKKLGLPAVPWKTFSGKESLNSHVLWTIRAAVKQENDFNRPSSVGVTA